MGWGFTFRAWMRRTENFCQSWKADRKATRHLHSGSTRDNQFKAKTRLIKTFILCFCTTAIPCGCKLRQTRNALFVVLSSNRTACHHVEKEKRKPKHPENPSRKQHTRTTQYQSKEWMSYKLYLCSTARFSVCFLESSPRPMISHYFSLCTAAVFKESSRVWGGASLNFGYQTGSSYYFGQEQRKSSFHTETQRYEADENVRNSAYLTAHLIVRDNRKLSPQVFHSRCR